MTHCDPFVAFFFTKHLITIYICHLQLRQTIRVSSRPRARRCWSGRGCVYRGVARGLEPPHQQWQRGHEWSERGPGRENCGGESAGATPTGDGKRKREWKKTWQKGSLLSCIPMSYFSLIHYINAHTYHRHRSSFLTSLPLHWTRFQKPTSSQKFGSALSRCALIEIKRRSFYFWRQESLGSLHIFLVLFNL